MKHIHEYLPPMAQSNGYTLLMLHGTGGNQFDLIPIGERLLPGAAIISPLGNVTEAGMARYFRRLSPGVFDIDDLKLRTQELAEFVTQASDTYALDRNRIVGAGYSNGANIAAALLLLSPETLRSAVLFRPMVPLVPEKRPNLDGVNVLICGGRRDEVVAPEESIRLAELLHESNATVSIHWTDAGHALTSEEISFSREWLMSKLT